MSWSTEVANLLSEYRIEGALSTGIVLLIGWISRRKGTIHPIRSIALFLTAPILRERCEIVLEGANQDLEVALRRIKDLREREKELESERNHLRAFAHEHSDLYFAWQARTQKPPSVSSTPDGPTGETLLTS